LRLFAHPVMLRFLSLDWRLLGPERFHCSVSC
jgi:hypothetical protein